MDPAGNSKSPKKDKNSPIASLNSKNGNLPELPKTKIVATIGPATWEDEVLQKMIDYGMTVARINASFADRDEMERVSKQIRGLSDKVALIMDAQGHKVRVNKLDKSLWLKKGDEFDIGVAEGVGDIWVKYENLLDDVKEGHRILLDDGNLELKLLEITDDRLKCEVLVGGELKTQKTLNFPDSKLSFPPLTEKDKRDMEYAVENEFEFVAASFIRNVQDVAAVKEYTAGTKTKIIAKIENPEGIENFNAIVREVDAVMIARGDLGVETGAEKVPALQKKMVRTCRELGKISIVATQMLESMRNHPRPTRAEVSDVANAVFDGADAVMLSAETSTGEYPVESVQWMAKAAKSAEDECSQEILFGPTDAPVESDAIARSVIEISWELPVTKIVVGSISGSTVMSIARHRPDVEIVAFCPSEIVMRQMNAVRGVRAVWVKDDLPEDRDWLVRVMMEHGLRCGLLKKEDMVILVSGAGTVGRSRGLIVEVAKVFDIAD